MTDEPFLLSEDRSVLEESLRGQNQLSKCVMTVLTHSSAQGCQTEATHSEQSQRVTSHREQELESLLRGSQRAFQMERDAKIGEVSASYSTQLHQKELTISNLEKVLVQKDAIIAEQAAMLSHGTEKLEEIVRKEKQHTLEVDGERKSEISRLRGEKEKDRLRREGLQSQLSSMAESNKLLLERASAAEERWHRAYCFQLMMAESREREAIEDCAHSSFNLLKHYQENMLASERGKAKCLSDFEDHVMTTVRESIPADEFRGYFELDSVRDIPKALDQIKCIHIQKLAERETAAAGMLAEMGRFDVEVKEINLRFSTFEEAAERKIRHVQERSEHLRRKLAMYEEREKTVSRSARAEGVVLDSLLSEYDADRQMMKTRIAQLEEDVRHYKLVNKASEAEDWQRKAELATRDVIELRDERSVLRAQVNALQSEAKNHDQQCAELSRCVRELKDSIKSQEVEQSSAMEELRSRLAAAQDAERKASRSDANALRDCAVLSEKVESLERQLETAQHSLELLRARWLEFEREPPSRQSHNEERNCSQTTLDDERHKELEHKVLLLKKERDTLRRQIDAANAEVAASEERRSNTMDRYLKLLSAIDAAPRREQAIQEQLFDIQRAESELGKKKEALDRRALEIERKEAQITRTIAAYQARGTNLLNASANMDASSMTSGRKSSQTPRTTNSDEESSAMLSSSLTPGNAALGVGRRTLAPIAARPLPASQPSTASHPQKPPKHWGK